MRESEARKFEIHMRKSKLSNTQMKKSKTKQNPEDQTGKNQQPDEEKRGKTNAGN